MNKFILNEAKVSGDEDCDNEIIDITDDLDHVTLAKENEFIDDNSVDEDVHFYRRHHNKRTVSDDEFEEEELFYEVPNSENAMRSSNNDNTVEIPDDMRSVYSTDNYEWNHYKLPTGNIYEFPNEKHFMKRFQSSLRMATKDNESVKGFLPLSQNYVGILEENLCNFEIPDNPLQGEDDSNKILQSKDCLFLNLLYSLRYTMTAESSHATDFSCLDQEMTNELILIKLQIKFDFVNARSTDKLHLINDTIIPYGFFLKSYVIQNKFRYLNLADQEKLKRQCELTSCVSKQFNGMLTVRAINQNTRKKNYLPVYIFIDCATSPKHFNNYFSNNPKSAFVTHYVEEGKNTKRKETYQCHYCDIFLNIRVC